jgi:serine/threonine-protein kinase
VELDRENSVIGETLNNRFTILSPLGEGGMGEVYLAIDQKTGEQVAVKILARSLSANPDSLERFRREAETLRQLDHPNIVKFVDAFNYGGQYVIVMEYVSGGSLHDLIKKGPLPIDRAQRLALELCDALIRSHHLNIIHRDLKPENVLLDADGRPKLADFGVARLEEGTRMTRTGTQVGTPYYMAPEAWGGKPLDAQADIWSLGIMLFEMLAGQVPFTGDTPLAVMSQVSTAPLPNLRKLRSDTPMGLINVIKRMLSRDKKRRYATMREVAVDLEREKQKTTTKPKSTADKPKRGRPVFTGNPKTAAIVVGGVVVLAITAGFPYISELLAGGQDGNITPAALSTSISISSEIAPSSTESSNLDATLTPTPIPETITQQGAEMVLIPGETFIMGGDIVGAPDEFPEHVVTLDAFYMDIFEVTNTLYKACVDASGCSLPDNTSKYDDPYYSNHPVVFVDWFQADAYCKWREARLPTEAEWHFSARGTTYLTPSNDVSSDTTTVGSYGNDESLFGLYDVNGNVWEWVNDWYDENYYGISPESNPQGPNTGEHKVMRGGSWDFSPFDSRPDNRHANHPGVQLNTVGFRCAKSAAGVDISLPTEITDKSGASVVLIPGGEFVMGASSDVQAQMLDLCPNCDPASITDQAPQRSIYVSPFWIYKTEVTIGQFRRFVESINYVTSAEKRGFSVVLDASTNEYISKPGISWSKPDGDPIDLDQYAEYPVTHVSLEDAAGYCGWAGSHLPSEAQWEKAARSVDGRFFPWGNTLPDNTYLNFNLANDGPVEVMSYPAGVSPYGVYDMAGNVWEWIDGFYAESYDPNDIRNPIGPPSGNGHVMRGGSWASELGAELVNIMTTFRFYNSDDFSSSIVGFRCAYSPF